MKELNLSHRTFRTTAQEQDIRVNAVTKILLAQLLLTGLVGVIAWIGLGLVAGYSAVLGGLTCVVPSAFLAARMLAVSRSGNPRKMLNATYLGEAGKLLITLALFVAIYRLVSPLNPGALLVGFVIVVIAGVWVAALTDKRALS